MTKLSINVNKVATLRNTRPLNIPNVVGAAMRALDAGAHGITVHPRPDERHIRPADMKELATMLTASKYKEAEFNIEGNPFHRYMEYAREYRPTQCTLVPDDEAQSTSDHGWNLSRDAGRLRPIIAELRSLKCRVSLFVDAEPTQMKIAAELGADRVELYTEPYAAAVARDDFADTLERFADTASAAGMAGLEVNAGHDLNLSNLPRLLEACPAIVEVSIGHALIADALIYGMTDTVRLYLEAIRGYPTDA